MCQSCFQSSQLSSLPAFSLGRATFVCKREAGRWLENKDGLCPSPLPGAVLLCTVKLLITFACIIKGSLRESWEGRSFLMFHDLALYFTLLQASHPVCTWNCCCRGRNAPGWLETKVPILSAGLCHQFASFYAIGSSSEMFWKYSITFPWEPSSIISWYNTVELGRPIVKNTDF